MKFSRTLSILLVTLAVWWSYKALMPSYKVGEITSDIEFSTEKALEHVREISKQPHGVGFPGHESVRTYIISELKKMGLQSTLQEGYALGNWGNLSKATNILARIKGTEKEKALLLLSHYDSSPHSSMGASDAGSGVATILEGIRAFLAQNKTPKNDIIILITDAEELGLNGAELFVNEHEWAKDVGLVLNFEARGSGGPSYMLIETNNGNSQLIKEFVRANPSYPVANSLAYSIYKMLPNDTDLTVFREDGDIDGFNFAFISDHFDYHTALDNFERLDRESLAHQGSYLMPLLAYFSEASLGNLKSSDDYIYFNMPFLNMVTYPFKWMWPLFGFALGVFLVLLFVGFRRGVLEVRSIFKGFLPLLLSLLLAGLMGYIAWPLLKWLYPGYNDMLHGFTYNGYTYILAVAFFALAACFWSYHLYRKIIDTPNILIAPICLWLVICALTNLYLPGASFFVIPLVGLLVALFVYINQKQPNPFLMVFLGLPAIFMYAPFIKMFPVGLGLKMLVAAAVFVVLLFVLLLPLFNQFKNKKGFSILFLFLFAICSIAAHINSDFTETNPKPSSLLYVYDYDKDNTIWATYDAKPIAWNGQFFKDAKKEENSANQTISSKYGTNFKRKADAPVKSIAAPSIDVSKDTIINNQRNIEVCVTPKRNVNRLDVFTNDLEILRATVNGKALSKYYLTNRRNGKLVTHFISNNEYTEIELVIPKESKLELAFYESSNDLLENELFSVPERPTTSIPMPFVLNDAIMTIKTLIVD